MRSSLAVFLTGWMMCAALAAAQPSLSQWAGIPQVTDPPPAVDGALSRLSEVTGWTLIEGKDHVVFGDSNWSGDADLSGTIVLGWDRSFLYVAAKVKDDVVAQPYSGKNLWKGDHVELMLDVPRQQGVRSVKKVFQFGISPGNFKSGNEAVAPEVYEWSPRDRSVSGALVGAHKTPDGYQVEAAIPWEAVGLSASEVRPGLRIGYDVLLSDADNPTDSFQSSIASLLTSPWRLRDPNRMVEGVLAHADGKVDPNWIKPSFERIRSDIEVKPKSSVEVPVAGKIDKEAIQELVVRARGQNRRKIIGGGNINMQVRLNGQVLAFSRIRNRLRRMEMGSRLVSSFGGGDAWFVMNAPNSDYVPPPVNSPYATPGVNPFEFRFDVADLWKKQGGNVVTITHTGLGRYPLFVEIGASEALSPKMMPPKRRPAPTGEIPLHAAITQAHPNYTFAQLPGGAFEVTLGHRKWVIDSKYSTTAPGWAVLQGKSQAKSQWISLKIDGDALSAATKDFQIHRTIQRHDDHLQVIDRIENISGNDLPVMFAHELTVDRDKGQLYIGGREVARPAFAFNSGSRPTVWFGDGASAIGMVGEDDVTRAQGEYFANGAQVGIRDRRLVIGKGKTLELEFSVYPLETTDRYAFINRIRRNWDANFTINGSAAVLTPSGDRWNAGLSDKAIVDYLRNKAVHYGIMVIYDRTYGGPPYGTNRSTKERVKILDRIAKLCPDVVRLAYYHCYLAYQGHNKAALPFIDQSILPKFKQDQILRADGSPATYRSSPLMPMFLPTDQSAWGREQEKQIDFIIKKTGANGWYWDEVAYSAYQYDYNPDHWDGLSADIDPKTHRIIRKITNVTLITQSWRLRMAKKMMAHGALVRNGQPATRTFMRLGIPGDVETGSITNLIAAQLYTPIALGDRNTERNEVDAYKSMVNGLNYGAVYYWYAPGTVATHPTLTSHMFPVTPINLGHGFLIAKERILTNTSGYFGWNDDSRFKVYVYDDRGNLTDEIKVPRVEKDGKAFAEVRIPEGCAVAIVRVPAGD